MNLIAGVDSTGTTKLIRATSDGSLAVSFNATQLTPTISDISTSGTISAGCKGLTFVFSPTFVGSVLGSSILGSVLQTLTIPIPPGSTLGSVAYTCTSGSMQAIQVI